MKEVRVALIGGAGFMGRAHSMAWSLCSLLDEVDVRVIKEVLVDVDEQAARAAACELDWLSSATDWESVVQRDDIDVVDIVTPNQSHGVIALAAIQNGKHVFCEKPLSNSAQEAWVMAAAANDAGIVNQVGFNYRHTPSIAFAKKLVDQGRFGQILEFRGSYLNESGFTRSPDRWRARRTTGGSGQVGDVGSHLVDIAQYLVGPIRRVNALQRARSGVSGRPWRDEADLLADPDLIDDTSLWLAEFDEGAVGSFAVSSYSSGRKNRLFFELDAEKGAVEFDWNAREQFRVSYTGDPADEQGFKTIYTSNRHPNGWWHLAGLGMGYLEVSATQFRHFVSAITLGNEASPSFADAAQVQSVIEAIARSANLGGWEKIGIGAIT